MTFAITQSCCADARCVSVCPVNAIHPTPDERAFGSTEMLHVDPRRCIDCGACADACPVDAIVPEKSLVGPDRVYADINAAWFADTTPEPATGPTLHAWDAPTFDRILPTDFAGLDVAVVGTGPAGMYATEDLLLHTGSRVTLIDRLDTPGGLVRFGVAPDHRSTRRVDERFERLRRHDRVRLRLGVELGRDTTHEQLLERHDAVIYAVGAADDRRLGVPGEEHADAATRFVGWYTGHPDMPADAFDLDTERVVVVGMGNVALDVARILLTDPDDLAGTAIAPHALAALRRSRVTEVVLLGRRPAGDPAYSETEMIGLRSTPGVTVLDHPAPAGSGGGRVVLRHGARVGSVDADGVILDDGSRIEAGLVLRAIGSRGTPTPGLPFDEATGTIPHTGGRVDGVDGAYVVGWAKRGPSGGIGANRACAAETVGTLLEDAWTHRLPVRRRHPLSRFVRRSTEPAAPVG